MLTPAGEHCDLGECIQDCNTVDPCAGELVCSPRARCVPPGAPDQDPPPETAFAGTVAVSPLASNLTAFDRTLRLTLTSDSAKPVRYRVQPNAPYLSIAAPLCAEVGGAGRVRWGPLGDAEQSATTSAAGSSR